MRGESVSNGEAAAVGEVGEMGYGYSVRGGVHHEMGAAMEV